MTQTLELQVSGMTCGGCENSVRNAECEKGERGAPSARAAPAERESDDGDCDCLHRDDAQLSPLGPSPRRTTGIEGEHLEPDVTPAGGRGGDREQGAVVGRLLGGVDEQVDHGRSPCGDATGKGARRYARCARRARSYSSRAARTASSSETSATGTSHQLS